MSQRRITVHLGLCAETLDRAEPVDVVLERLFGVAVEDGRKLGWNGRRVPDDDGVRVFARGKVHFGGGCFGGARFGGVRGGGVHCGGGGRGYFWMTLCSGRGEWGCVPFEGWEEARACGFGGFAREGPSDGP